MAHTLRQERRELARQQEELRRQMEQEAEAERYAQEQWEYEQEQAEQREQKRQDEIAGQMAIANAIRGAAYDIGMAYAEREAARDAADYRERQAAREAARPSNSPAPSSSGGYGSSGQDANERAAQLAARQAELERRQAELRQRQALASAPRPAPTPAASYGSGAGSSSSPGSVGSTESHGFTIADHNVGRVSATRQILGLAVTLEVRRVGLRISGADRSEICANFENRTAANWSGGYRLTDRDARDTHASMSVPAGGTARKCETLNPQTGYTVVLRQDRG
jgi:multidrug efflux pump subunit AcrA (membrane-fusion protein)